MTNFSNTRNETFFDGLMDVSVRKNRERIVHIRFRESERNLAKRLKLIQEVLSLMKD